MISATIIISVFSLICSLAIVLYDRHCLKQLLSARDAREDKLLQRIQAPQVAIAQQVADQVVDYPQPYIGGFDDDAAAEYEQQRDRLERSTHELIASVEGA